MAFILTVKGTQVWQDNPYSPEAVTGVSVLVVAAAISLVAVVGMLVAIVISSFKTGHALIRSHLGAYFVSLVMAELVQATGSLMSARWIVLRQVELGHFCATQGALKNAGNVSTALWSMIIAFHTFTLIFLKIRVAPWIFYCTLILTWGIVGFIVILGPAALETSAGGPFWGISGYWCWITDDYSLERFTMEYLFMFITAGVSVVLYSLIFLRLRGNIEGVGMRITFCRARTPWQRDTSMSDPQIARVGKRMLWYPMAYVILILPIAACRWSEIYGAVVPFGVTIFADTVFLLSGLVNAVLYSTTRRVAPINTIIPSYGSRKSDKGLESFESGDPKAEVRCFGSRGLCDERTISPSIGSAQGLLHSDSHGDLSSAQYPAPPQEFGDVRAVSDVRRGAVGSRSSGSSMRSRSASVVSAEYAGYPGPQVQPATAQPPVPPREPETASVISKSSSRSKAFDKDWI